MAQTWHDLLFIHWPVPIEALRPLVPEPLQIEEHGGTAWIGIVPFRMSGIRLRGLPALPGTGAFPELNVRTYVTFDDKPGVWFFSLDATSRMAVFTARAWFALPYYLAHIEISARKDAGLRYSLRRTHKDVPSVEFAADYHPVGDVVLAPPDSLDAFLTERYCLYALSSDGQLRRAEIHHEPWPLQPAEAYIRSNTMVTGFDIALPDEPPRLHFSRRLDVVVWSPQVLEPSKAPAS